MSSPVWLDLRLGVQKIVCKGDKSLGPIGEDKIKFEQKEKRLYFGGERSHGDFGNNMMKTLEFIWRSVQ